MREKLTQWSTLEACLAYPSNSKGPRWQRRTAYSRPPWEAAEGHDSTEGRGKARSAAWREHRLS